MNKYEAINDMKFQQNFFINNSQTNYGQNYDYHKEFNDTLNNLETNIHEHYNTNYNLNNNLNYYEIKNIVRNEFAELIIPYQKQLNNVDNIIERKINNVECNLKGIIDSKSLDNLNQTAQMINLFMKNSNRINQNQNLREQKNNNIENVKNNLEKQLNLALKQQYDNKFDVLERQINSMDSLLKTFKKTFDSNMLDIFKNKDIKKSYIEKQNYEKHKDEIDLQIKKIKEELEKYKSMSEQIEKLYENINILTLDNNNYKTSSLNEINLLKNNYNNINKTIFEIQNKLNNSQIDKIKDLNIDNLKYINIYEIDEMKENIKTINNNLDDLYDKAKNNDKQFNNMFTKFNELEQNLNYINKDVDFLNKQNLNEKLEEYNKKLVDLNKKLDATNKKENIDKIMKDNENKEDKNNSENKNDENENLFGLTGSRRQRKTLTKSEIHNNLDKINNLNLDENAIKILKQIENIDINNINKKLESLSNENKIILSKIETNNDNFMNINDQENKLNIKIDELNKKIKESENRLYLLELKNFGNVNDNNNINNNNIDEVKENNSPILSKDNNNKTEDSKINEINKSKVDNNLNNIYNNDNNSRINLDKNNEDELIEKIMKEENNNYKEQNSFGLNKEDKSNKDISISGLIKPILDDDKNEKNNENNSKLKDEQLDNNKNNNFENFDDFDDI